MLKQQLDLWSLYTQEDALRIVNTLRIRSVTVPESGCILFQGSRNRDGYGLVKVSPTGLSGKSTQKSVLTHRLAYRAAHDPPVEANMHISHLCHQRACINPQHLLAERRESNIARIGCPGSITCPCGTVAYVCPHQPQCFLRSVVRLPAGEVLDDYIDLDEEDSVE